jgi:hypothetical protein
MAKRRKTRKTPARRYSRRKSMGAVSGGIVMDIAGITVGALLAKQVGKLLPNLNPKIASAGKVALGVALPMFVKSPIMKSIGNGMLAVGGVELIGSFIPALAGDDDVVLLSGLDDIGAMDISEINGLDDIGGMDEIGAMDISEINGFDEEN